MAVWLGEWREREGIDLQSGQPHALYLLPSPDGRFLVRISDSDDPWHRVTIVDTASGRKEIILDKDDAILVIPQALFTLFVLDPIILLNGGI